MGNGVTMFELPAEDLNRAQEFYRQAFGWQTAPLPGLSTIAHVPAGSNEETQRMVIEAIPTPVNENGFPVEPGMITGILTQRVREITTPVIIVEVEDIEDAIGRVEGCGGEAIVGCHQAGEFGFFAYITDTEGNIVCLWKDAVPGIRIGVAAET